MQFRVNCGRAKELYITSLLLDLGRVRPSKVALFDFIKYMLCLFSYVGHVHDVCGDITKVSDLMNKEYGVLNPIVSQHGSKVFMYSLVECFFDTHTSFEEMHWIASPQTLYGFGIGSTSKIFPVSCLPSKRLIFIHSQAANLSTYG